jgi:hypothetical protein
VRINQAEPLEGVSTISEAQAQVLNALKVNKPIKNEQMSLPSSSVHGASMLISLGFILKRAPTRG